MALMNWAIDVPQELLQSDAKTRPLILLLPYATLTKGICRGTVLISLLQKSLVIAVHKINIFFLKYNRVLRNS
jgi:hypothetical protein